MVAPSCCTVALRRISRAAVEGSWGLTAQKKSTGGSCFSRFTTPLSGGLVGGARHFSSVKFMDQKRSGEETVYFKKEDEALLRNLLANHPEYDPKYSMDQMSELGAIARDITLACQKHGMKDPSAAFMKDLISIFSAHGYVKQSE
ncbi:hypothetical protein BESB_034640 [Besnoitia besnoiti]|uniref:Uncharacterized protein n=1 Tax=Besnoitia besnoiti TaxID=94643 RepID=A0A2A9MLS6_BESBE|nr:hypothetical protein BESB_034640 [Besnoitia besnoiti]PFH37006.1 hypothetical protein BESB_034640 [Besnoitia besnoiti]